MTQVDLFGQAVHNRPNAKSQGCRYGQAPSISIFHDESGDYGHSDWVFTGLFWIEELLMKEFCEDLQKIRLSEDYYGEIHFKNLPKSFGGEYGRKARVGQNWFNLWAHKWSKKTYFNVVAINRKHPKYEHDRFPHNFHAYNRFVLMGLRSGLTWFFKKYSKIYLSIYSDGKSRRPQGIIPDGVRTDNFEDYIRRQLIIDGASYNGPNIILHDNGLKCINCPKKGPFNPCEELIQFTDLMLGSVSSAVETRANKPTKIWFAKKMASFMMDIRIEPWNQKYNLHRKLSISYFPNNDGKIYNDGPVEILNISKKMSQKKLFG
jgi:hypothetical protein